MYNIYNFLENLANTLGQENNKSTFYKFIKDKFHEYETSLKENATDIDIILMNANELKGNNTSARFINLVKKIDKQCIRILEKAYKGDLLSATNQLRSLLVTPKNTDYKLTETYVNYLPIRVFKDSDLFRCVDFKAGDTPVSCNHLPFNLRHLASRERFNQLGVPCLYLSSSLECCQLEIGSVAKDKERWYGTFEVKRPINLADFSIPSVEYIKSMTFYEMFSFLVTYPLRLLCLTKSKENVGKFVEEYLFSQLFLHVLFLNKNNKLPNFDGICYTSMKDRSCLNLVIPAKYSSNEPPTEGLSDFIQSLILEKNVRKI